MNKFLIIASTTLVLGAATPAFAAGDETGGGVTTPQTFSTTTYSQPASEPEVAAAEEMTLLEYLLSLFAESDD